MSYELWDIASGNLLGEYATEREALEVVADLAVQYRSRCGRSLDWLSLHRGDGPRDRVVVATGPQLIALLEQTRKARGSGSLADFFAASPLRDAPDLDVERSSELPP